MPKKDATNNEEISNQDFADEITADAVVDDSETVAIPSIDDVSDNASEENVEFSGFSQLNSGSPAEDVSVDSDAPVTIQTVQFASFEDSTPAQGEINKNLDILMDIKLQMTVELGRTELPVKKVLELTRGSIVELEKVAGEPVELYANGKLVAHGEVVVIEDNFGLRITSITDPEDRLKGL